MNRAARWRVRLDEALCADVAGRVSERRARSHLLVGPAGIGKSTVLAAVGERLRLLGHPLIPLAGSAALTEVPLAAFAPLLAVWPGHAADDTTAARLQRIYDELAPARADHVLLIDDAHLLDLASATIVARLVRAYGVRALLTAPSAGALGDEIARLAEDGVVAPTALPGLDADAAAMAVERTVGDRVDPDDLRDLHARTGGNPLQLREIVTAALAEGPLAAGDRGLRLPVGAVPPRLRRVVLALYQNVDAVARREAELLAAGESLPVPRSCAAAVETLSTAGLIERDGARWRLAQPLHAEVLLDALPPAEREERHHAAASRLRRGGRADRLRGIAVLARTSRPPSVAELDEAARDAHARQEYRLVVELVDLAVELSRAGDRPVPDDALLARADALSLLGELDQAETAFEALLSTTADQTLLARAASRLGFHHALRRRDPAQGARVAAAAGARLHDDDAIAYLDANVAKLRFWSGGGLTDDESAAGDERQALNVTLLRLSRSVFTGELDQARLAIEQGRPLAARHHAAHPHAGAAVDFGEFLLRVDELRAADARRHVEAVRAVRDDDSAGLWHYALALLALLRDDLGESIAQAAAAVESLAWRDLLAAHGPATALLAAAAARGGDRDRAVALLAGLSASQRAANVPTLLQAAEAEAWLRAADEDADAAAEIIADAAARGFAARHDTFAALTCLVALRLDRPAAVAHLLRDSPARGTAPLVAAAHDYAAALSDGSAAGLLAVAETFAAAGFEACARDAAAQARARARIQRARGVGRRAGALADRLSASPAAEGDAWPDALTSREDEIARLAAGRARNREIAERLGISPRTVENHLASVYRKLGVAGRDRLAAALLSTGTEKARTS